jgi:hypothetical protein
MKKKALLLMLFFMFISTNVLAKNVIWGYVTGDKVKNVTVKVEKVTCGGTYLVRVGTTNDLGLYGIGNLEDGIYTVAPEASGYDFFPNFRFVYTVAGINEYGNVNFISSKTCKSICSDEFDYCMENASAWWMNCTFSGGLNCAAEDWLHTETCKNDKELCQDQCEEVTRN